MVPNAIERDILIEAPVEVVWRVITEPDQITQWFSDAADIDLRPGGEGSLTFGEKASHESVAVLALRVQAVEPPHRFAFRWEYPEGAEPREGNSLYVEFTLTEEGEHTRLRVVESGFAMLGRTEEETVAYIDVHTKGWEMHTARLRDYVAGQS